MVSTFKLKADTYRYTGNGEEGFSQETAPPYVLFCDAVPVSDEEQSPIDIVEKSVHEKLSTLSPEKLNEMALIGALQYANTKLYEHLKRNKDNVVVSAVILAINPFAIDPATREKGAELIVAGLGDCRVYQINQEELSLTFYDPRNPFRSLFASPKTRLASLENVLGRRANIHVQTRKVFKKDSQRYLIASCGVYQQATEKELHTLGCLHQDPKVGAISFFNSCKSKENDLRFVALTLDGGGKSLSLPHKKTLNPRRRFQTVATVVATSVVVVAITTFLLKYKDQGISQSSAISHSLSESPALIALQKQTQSQTEMIASMKKEIDDRSSELQNLKDQFASLQKNKSSEEALPDFKQAAKAIEELHKLLKEKEQHAQQLTETSVSTGVSKIKNTISAATHSALQAVNTQLKQQYDSLAKAYAQQKVQKSTLDSLITDIKQSFNKKEHLLASTIQSFELAKQEAAALQEVIIKLQKSTLAQLEQAKKQISKQINDIRRENIERIGTLDEEDRPRREQHLSELRPRVYTVVPGDTLSSISKRFYGSSERWKDIYETNVEDISDKDHLIPGTKLLIP